MKLSAFAFGTCFIWWALVVPVSAGKSDANSPVKAAPGKEAAAREYARFKGSWTFVSLEVEGTKVDADEFKDSSLILKDKHFTMKSPEGTYQGTFTVDVGKKPKWIDVMFIDGPEKGKTALGIYELEGDIYKVCIGLPGKSRPKQFMTRADSGHILEVLKRQ